MNASAAMPPSPAMIANEKIARVDRLIDEFKAIEKTRELTVGEDLQFLGLMIRKSRLLKQL